MPAQGNLGSSFYPKLVQMTSEVGMNPEDLLAIMVSESGISPSAGKSGNTAAGLIQFMPFILPGVGFHGTPDEFRHMTGEDQLPYIKRYIADKVKYNGGPFKSAAQYYVANFWPVALKLSGVKQENPNTPIVEANPATVTDPKTGKRFSKKYYDLGIHISPHEEAEAYKENPLFHGSVPGAITYGDMQKQVDKNKRTPMYRRALLAMENTTGYQPKPDMGRTKVPSSMVAQKAPPAGGLEGILDQYVRMLSTTSEASLKRMYKKALPSHDILIKITAPDYTSAIEFSRILCAALDEDLLATTYPHTDGQEVEVECCIAGPTNECFAAVQQMSVVLAEVFHDATAKIGGIVVKTKCAINKKSSYQPISLQTAGTHYRKFLLKFIQGKQQWYRKKN